MARIRWMLAAAAAVYGLNTVGATATESAGVQIVSKPIQCLELNATGTIVYNRCTEFVRFTWRNTTNCQDSCETEIAPESFAVVSGLEGRHFYGACRSDQTPRWLGWRYSCYARRDR